MERKPTGIEHELQELHTSSFGWALTCCNWNRQEAEEALQVAYLKAIDGRARFNGFSSTRTWFFSVVKNTAAERRRTRRVRDLALGRWLQRRPEPDPAPSPERLSDWAERQARLRESLRTLSPRQRDLLHLVFYQELTIEDAAHVLGISVGSARTHYGRGKSRLRVLLSDERQR